MLEKTGLNSYHHTDSLLFQFVLNDFLLALEEVAIIKALTEESTQPEDFFHKITDYLIKLAGSEQEYMRIFSWIVDSGVLTKLKNTSDLLSERANKSDDYYIDLHNAAHKAWLDCLHTVDLLQELKKGRGNLLKIVELKKSVEKSIASIIKLKPVIKKIIPKYAQDENVLYFILRHRDLFDKHLGKEWTKKFFKALHPHGALDYMTEKYTQRGFTNLIPEINEKLQLMAS